MGETGATNTNGNHDERAKWAYCVAQNAQRYGVPIVIWGQWEQSDVRR